MNKIIIGFSRPNGWFEPFSYLIRLVQGWSPYSHAYVRFYLESSNQWIVLQASGLKVNMITWENFQKIEIIVKEFEISMTSEKHARFLRWAFLKLGIPYGVLPVIGIGIVLFLKMLGITVKNPFPRGQSELFCSELVDYTLLYFTRLPLEEYPDVTTPKDLMDLLTKYQDKIQVLK